MDGVEARAGEERRCRPRARVAAGAAAPGGRASAFVVHAVRRATCCSGVRLPATGAAVDQAVAGRQGQRHQRPRRQAHHWKVLQQRIQHGAPRLQGHRGRSD